MKKRARTLCIAAWLIGSLCGLHGNAHAAFDAVSFKYLKEVQLRSSGALYVSVELSAPDSLTCGNNPAGARIYLPANFPNHAIAAQLIIQAYIAKRSGLLALKDVGSECEITRITFY